MHDFVVNTVLCLYWHCKYLSCAYSAMIIQNGLCIQAVTPRVTCLLLLGSKNGILYPIPYPKSTVLHLQDHTTCHKLMNNYCHCLQNVERNYSWQVTVTFLQYNFILNCDVWTAIWYITVSGSLKPGRINSAVLYGQLLFNATCIEQTMLLLDVKESRRRG